jgi:hypothetical protein
LGIYPKKYKSVCNTIVTPAHPYSTIQIRKLWNHPRCPTIDECIKNMWYIYTMEYYSAIKKSEVVSFLGEWINWKSC